jgi:peptidoglycan/LPS O-acetylase OafA/YrhL
MLFVLALVSGAALVHLAVNSKSGDIIGGWSLDPEQLRIGFTRVMYPFFTGLLLYKIVRLRFIGNGFFWSSLLLLIVLCMPRVGGQAGLWKNGLYDSLSVILVFPLVVYIGACGQVKGRVENSICKFLGEISYPLYISHYPINYIYTGWVSDHHPGLSTAFPVAAICFVSSIALAYASLKLFDEPVRKWLKKKVLV